MILSRCHMILATDNQFASGIIVGHVPDHSIPTLPNKWENLSEQTELTFAARQ